MLDVSMQWSTCRDSVGREGAHDAGVRSATLVTLACGNVVRAMYGFCIGVLAGVNGRCPTGGNGDRVVVFGTECYAGSSSALIM